ncbi:MAG: stage II sporulation protein M [Tenericutes bacterium]|nr:stage II sporulation protein M [Mycoplasmatota bacterium]
MKKLLSKYRKNKLLMSLIIILILTLIAGTLYLSILSSENKELVTNSITTFFTSLNTKLDTKNILFKTLSNNLLTISLVWLLGFSIIGIPLVLLILIFKSFTTFFTFVSIIYTYKYIGIIKALIYIIPYLLNLFMLFILTYYSLNFSIMLFNYLFKKKDYNRSLIIKRYLKLLIISILFMVVTAVIETYVIPAIFKFITL